jgi:hypothetical protein
MADRNKPRSYSGAFLCAAGTRPRENYQAGAERTSVSTLQTSRHG